MLNITHSDRKEISTKIMDIGNLTFGALTLGQAFSEHSFDFLVGTIGLLMLFAIYGLALLVKKGGKLWTTKRD